MAIKIALMSANRRLKFMISVHIIVCLFLLMMKSNAQPKWVLYDHNQLVREQAQIGDTYHQFLKKNSMTMGLYHLKISAKDDQTPHKYDEVYYIWSGKADFVAGAERSDVGKGSLIYVKAGIEHRFVDIKEDLQVYVIFSRSEPNMADIDWKAIEVKDLAQYKKPDANEWYPFFDVGSLQFGLYMLPLKLGGDESLTHKVDEVNIVIKGKAKFQMDDEIVDVKPGSIIYVEHSVGHKFFALTEDFEVLILFPKNSHYCCDTEIKNSLFYENRNQQ
jgi:mannose-6-phosphate isomerase-like protein (cupin superfamily)